MIAARLVATQPPSPEQGRRLLREELARPEYARSWWSRLEQWVQDLFAGGLSTGSTSWTPLLVVLAVLAAAILLAVAGRALARRRRRTRSGAEADALTEAGVGAAAYRERAAAHLAAGRPTEAYLDAFRALAAHADATGLATPSPRRTAGALGRALAEHRPDLAADLRRAAATFDGIRYGHAGASGGDVAAVLALPARLGSPGSARPDAADLAPVGGAS